MDCPSYYCVLNFKDIRPKGISLCFLFHCLWTVPILNSAKQTCTMNCLLTIKQLTTNIILTFEAHVTLLVHSYTGQPC